ncbi:MAG TPA: tetratricopeptide repeat protein [Candidatus Saccharimonadales bacterium]|nr:tetratricopeptide repeat protein [Candidatus Saccharimonadales bacterium]
MPRSGARKRSSQSRGAAPARPGAAAASAAGAGGAWWPALALALVAVGLRGWSVAALSRDWRVTTLILDGRYYMKLAAFLSHGLSWPSGPFFMTPLYPVLLSFLFRAFPATPLTVQVAQSVLGLGTLALLVAAARRELGPAAGWALGGLFALCGPVLGLESQVLTESLLLFLASAALWFWPRPGRGAASDLAFGAACGLLSIGRGIYLAVPAAAVLLLWLSPRRGDARAGASRPAAARLVRTAAVALGVAAALLPMAVHQTRTTGHLNFTTLNGGLNLYLGNNPTAQGMYSHPPDFDPLHDVTGLASASQAAGRPLDFEAASRYWTGRALEFVRRNPGRAVWLAGRKFLLSFSPLEIPQVEDFQVLREHEAPLRWAFVDFRWILPLAALGLATAGRDRLRRLIPWLVFPAVGVASTVVFFATGRYRLAVLPGYLAPAALGVVALIEMARGRRPVAAAAVLPVVVGLQLLLPSYPIEDGRARDAHEQGVRQLGAGQPELAAQSFSLALKHRPDWELSWQGLASARVQQGRLPEAQDALERALRIAPGSAGSHSLLGAVCWQRGDTARALGEQSRAVELESYNVQYRADLALGLERAHRKREAVEQWGRVLAAQPRDETARRHLRALGAEAR